MLDNVLDDVLAQLRERGLEPFGKRNPDWVFGKLTRCKAEGDKVGEQTGWYVLHEYRTEKGKTLYFGAFGDWRSGETHKIKLKGVQLTAEERELMRARQEEAKRKAAERAMFAARRAAKRAASMWERLPEKGRSPYLERKQIVGLGVRYSRKGAVLVPMRTAHGIVGLQVIHPAKQEDTGRDKQYWPWGMQKEGAWCLLGPHPEPGETILIAEGYATGVSLHMATSCTVAVAFDAGNLLPVGKAMREQFPGRPLVFCADDDWKTTRQDGSPWNPGMEKADNAAVILGGQVVAPVFGEGREDGWTDWNDLHCAEGLEAVRRQVMAMVRPPASGGWREKLQRSESGALIAHPYNVQLILNNDERWAGTIAYNAFSSKVLKRRTPPYGGSAGDWTDLDDARVVVWLAEQYNLRVKSAAVVEAVCVVASDNEFHPVREYLKGLVWDGERRLDGWLSRTFSVPISEYSLKVGTRWMISAVARVMRPGCKADAVLILEGKQGAGKSTAMSILGGAWFMDTPFSLGDKDGFQAIRGKWIIELGELDSFNKAESTKAKQFFSASTDTYRESYGRRVLDVPRQCVFVGTTNQDEYLKDPTGNRRYWPVMCHRVNLDELRETRDQLWAEAYARWDAGERWWVERDEADKFAEEQDARYMVDAWEHPIREWLEDPAVGEAVTIDQILRGALNLDYGHWGKPEQMRVGHIMNRLEWRRKRLPASRRSGIRPWGYQRPASWSAATPAKEEPF